MPTTPTIAESKAYRSAQGKMLAHFTKSVLNGAELCLYGKTFRRNDRTGLTIQHGNSAPWIMYRNFDEWRNELDKAMIEHYFRTIEDGEMTWEELYRRTCINRDYGEFMFSAVMA